MYVWLDMVDRVSLPGRLSQKETEREADNPKNLYSYNSRGTYTYLYEYSNVAGSCIIFLMVCLNQRTNEPWGQFAACCCCCWYSSSSVECRMERMQSVLSVECLRRVCVCVCVPACILIAVPLAWPSVAGTAGVLEGSRLGMREARWGMTAKYGVSLQRLPQYTHTYVQRLTNKLERRAINFCSDCSAALTGHQKTLHLCLVWCGNPSELGWQ